MSERNEAVIVGGGLAAAKAVESLRENGLEGRIVLIGEEPELPYERPPLSKDYLRGESDREAARPHPAEFYAENEIELRTGTRVEEIATAEHEVVLAGGERIGWERLLAATGAEPRRLDLPGSDLDGILYLRDFADADRLSAALGEASRVAVVGAGWIGAEVAASARQLDVDVTLIERAEVPLEAVLGREVGAIYADVHREHDVELLAGAATEGFEGDRRVEAVRIADGDPVACDLVVVGIGVVPRTGLAEAAGIEIDNGIVADERLETSVPGIFAAGDVVNAHNPFYERRLRVEHWANAIRTGEEAGRTMVGLPAGEPQIPYFFSDQYDVGMEYRGYASGDDEVVFRGDTKSREFIAFWLQDDRVAAAMNVNVWDYGDEIEALIRSRQSVDRERLRDPDVPIDRLADG
jgi:3-phenylpropionate/trans-cinnamate dioxygenase ferredoxin reductase subunit